MCFNLCAIFLKKLLTRVCDDDIVLKLSLKGDRHKECRTYIVFATRKGAPRVAFRLRRNATEH